MFPNLFHERPASTRLQSYLEGVATSAGIVLPEPDVKVYPNTVYFNYYALGISLLFIPIKGNISTRSPLDYENLSLDSIDIFNAVERPTPLRTFSQFPLLPVELFASHPADTTSNSAPEYLEVKGETTGQDFVRTLGEPTRKGGGAGPSSGSISIWCEWSKLGVMVEFGGGSARGLQAWERGKDAVWKVLTLFQPTGIESP